jgi:hypothetical protein
MKTPIEPSEIRKGDLIRAEFGNRDAREYVAGRDAHHLGVTYRHYLLDRPKPAVELPTEPTLGWVHFSEGAKGWLGFVDDQGGSDGLFNATTERGYASNCFIASRVTAFIPATAVPTEHWTALVAEHDQFHADREFCSDDQPVCALVAAVDKANGGASS